MKSGFRFDPPAVEVTADISWAFSRAFGSPEKQNGIGRPQISGELFDTVQRYDLAARIGARIQRTVLEEEVGSEIALRVEDAKTAVTARALVVEHVCCELAEASKALSVPILFLKGAALQLSGVVAAGSRPMADIDIVIPESKAEIFGSGLPPRGFSVETPLGSDHDLLLFVHRTSVVVETHRWVPGISLGDKARADFDGIFEARLCERAEGLPGRCFFPTSVFLIAHALVHGIGQHGLAPEKYPMVRMLADLQDLMRDANRWREFMDSGVPWVAANVSPREILTVQSLLRRFDCGDDVADFLNEGGDDAKLLRHMIAGPCDESYRRALRPRHRLAQLDRETKLKEMVGFGMAALWLTPAQIDHIYGRPKSNLGYWGWRLWRPFDLVGRAWRYGAAAVRHRLKQR